MTGLFSQLMGWLSRLGLELGRWVYSVTNGILDYFFKGVQVMLNQINNLIPPVPATISDMCPKMTASVGYFADVLWIVPWATIGYALFTVVAVVAACLIIKLYMRALSLASFGGGAS